MQAANFFPGCFDNGEEVSRAAGREYRRIVVRKITPEEMSNLQVTGWEEQGQSILFWETCVETPGSDGSSGTFEITPALVFLEQSPTGELMGRYHGFEVFHSKGEISLTALVLKSKLKLDFHSMLSTHFDTVEFAHDEVNETVRATFLKGAVGHSSQSVLFSKRSAILRDTDIGDVILQKYEPGISADGTRVASRPIALVTGGGSGIGAGISNALARDGYNVVLGYNTNRTRCETWGKVLTRRHGATAICVGGDIAKDETFNLLFAAVDTFPQGGKLVAAVHCAGQYIGITSKNHRGLAASGNLCYGNGSLFEATSNSVNFGPFNFYMDMYGKGFCALAERASSRMSDGVGYIVGITAPGCNAMTTPRAGTYDMPMAGKAVMEQMARYYAKNLASRRITVNCISPGLTATPAWEKFAEHLDLGGPTKSFIEKTAETRSPMKASIQPSDIGNAAAFLCSDRARFISGVTLPVDGALHLIS
jgi:NAD(P)-dependent dehydrogenase (short-subunit alcohol dehydrogenase family)